MKRVLQVQLYIYIYMNISKVEQLLIFHNFDRLEVVRSSLLIVSKVYELRISATISPEPWSQQKM